MIRLLIIASIFFWLGGCALLGEVGVVEMGAADGLAARAVAAQGEALAGASTAGEVMAARSAIFVDGNIAISRSGPLGEALADIAENRASLVIQDGVVRVGTQEVGSLQGANLFARGRLVGRLEADGLLVEEPSGAVRGRLRGFIPQDGGRLELADGTTSNVARSIAVDILGYNEGSYLVRLASGQTATYHGVLTAVALTAAILATDCDSSDRSGFALRISGEVVPFTSCRSDRDVVTLAANEGPVLLDRREIVGLMYTSRVHDDTVDKEASEAPSSFSPSSTYNYRSEEDSYRYAEPARIPSDIAMEHDAL